MGRKATHPALVELTLVKISVNEYRTNLFSPSDFSMMISFFLKLGEHCKSRLWLSVADPNPDPAPSDPHVFGPPGSGSPDPLVRGMDPDPDPDPSIVSNSKKNLDFYCDDDDERTFYYIFLHLVPPC
jgi:hypothetical protein